MIHRRRRVVYIRLWPLVISLMATTVLSVVLAVHFTPDMVRWINLRRLCSRQAEQQARGMSYLVRHAEDAEVQRACRRLLERADPPLRRRIIGCLRYAGVWDERFGRAWLAELERQVGDEHSTAAQRAVVAMRLGQAGLNGSPIRTEPACRQLLERLLDDAEVQVRYAALRAAITLPGGARQALLWQATGDDQPAVARHAWIFLGLLWRQGQRPEPEHRLPDLEQLLKMEDSVAWACLWAEAVLHDQAEQSLAVRAMKTARPAVRNFIPYVLHELEQAELPAGHGPRWWGRFIEPMPRSWEARADWEGLTGAWRAVLAMPREVFEQFFRDPADWDGPAGGKEQLDGMGAAVLWRMGGRPWDWPAWTGREDRRLRELARLEAAPVGGLDLGRIDPYWPYLAVIDAVRASKNAEPDDLMVAFNADLAGMRHLACLVAMQRFNRVQVAGLIDRLLASHWDRQRISGALLAALAGMEGQRLAARAAVERQWHVLQCMKVALKMLGRPEGYEADVADLFVRKDIAASFLYIAMLRTGDKRVLDRLFSPLGGDGGWLERLLDEHRFEPFLRMHLPQAPPLWLWADEALQRFQAEVMRNWYLLNRNRLRYDAARRQFLLADGGPVH